MKKALIAAAVAVGAVLATSGVAEAATVPAASQMDCNSAAQATVTAQANFNAALNVAINRAKQMGFTSDEISQAQSILGSGTNITSDQQSQLEAMFQKHIDLLSVTSDLAKVKAVLDAKLAVSAAVAAQNIACVGFVPGNSTANMPMTTVPPVTTTTVPPTTTTPPVTNLGPGTITLQPGTVLVVPKVAPKAGDGSRADG